MTGVDVLDAAVRNNAHWCDLVCRAHGAQTRFDDHAWCSSTRTLPLYPDAITLQPGPLPERLLASIDTSPGCSIKDSFATLDLGAHGFHVLFAAQWIASAEVDTALYETGARDLHWTIEHTPSGLDQWRRAWSAVEGRPAPFVADVLRHRHVAVMAAYASGRLIAGALFVRSDGVVAISNFFSADGDSDHHWSSCLAAARSSFPDWTIVGYESGRRLEGALRNGFEALGPLRVWVND
jgi:hypothetical protein